MYFWVPFDCPFREISKLPSAEWFIKATDSVVGLRSSFFAFSGKSCLNICSRTSPERMRSSSIGLNSEMFKSAFCNMRLKKPRFLGSAYASLRISMIPLTLPPSTSWYLSVSQPWSALSGAISSVKAILLHTDNTLWLFNVFSRIRSWVFSCSFRLPPNLMSACTFSPTKVRS